MCDLSIEYSLCTNTVVSNQRCRIFAKVMKDLDYSIGFQYLLVKYMKSNPTSLSKPRNGLNSKRSNTYVQSSKKIYNVCQQSEEFEPKTHLDQAQGSPAEYPFTVNSNHGLTVPRSFNDLLCYFLRPVERLHKLVGLRFIRKLLC